MTDQKETIDRGKLLVVRSQQPVFGENIIKLVR